MSADLLETVEVETGASPTAAVVWLHGLGADGNDFVPIVRELDLRGAPPVRFVFPHAPAIPVTLNGGYAMRAWYDIVGLDIPRQEDEPGLRTSRERVEALIAREKARGIPAERIVLGGFSQGCAMTLMTGLRHAAPLAGLIGLSGYLPLAARTAAERHAAGTDVPVFLAHGTRDPVVPYAAGVASRDALQRLGVRVEWHEYPMEHTVSLEEIRDMSVFLRKVLGAA